MSSSQSLEERECCVCGDTRSQPKNDIIFCDGKDCDIAVHMKCYGIKELPDEDQDWFCRRCSDKVSVKATKIACCPNRGGALVNTTLPGVYAHVVCVAWNKLLNLASLPVYIYPFAADKQPCSICGITKGTHVLCSVAGCRTWFHVTCGIAKKVLRPCPVTRINRDNIRCAKHQFHRHSGAHRLLGAAASPTSNGAASTATIPAAAPSTTDAPRPTPAPPTANRNGNRARSSNGSGVGSNSGPSDGDGAVDMSDATSVTSSVSTSGSSVLMDVPEKVVPAYRRSAAVAGTATASPPAPAPSIPSLRPRQAASGLANGGPRSRSPAAVIPAVRPGAGQVLDEHVVTGRLEAKLSVIRAAADELIATLPSVHAVLRQAGQEGSTATLPDNAKPSVTSPSATVRGLHAELASLLAVNQELRLQLGTLTAENRRLEEQHRTLEDGLATVLRHLNIEGLKPVAVQGGVAGVVHLLKSLVERDASSAAGRA